VATEPVEVAGSAGNERLTAITAVVLIVLLAVEGVTILAIRPLLSWHVFVGMLLIPPVALKLASTGYRFWRYYSGSPAYVRRGPPHVLLRLLAPLVVVSTLTLFGTGVTLIALGPRYGLIFGLHKASFVVWLVATGAHVLAHVQRLPSLAFGAGRGAGRRLALVTATLFAGGALAVSTLSLATPWIHLVDRDDAASAHLNVLM
jgi:hypothetical protein